MNKNNRNGAITNFSSFFYSLAITLGIYTAIKELHYYQNISNFYVFSIALLVIYCIELFTAYQQKSNKIEINLNIHDKVNELSHFFHKLVLPIALYLALLGFGYFNLQSDFLPLVLLITFLSFFVLFINTKAFLQNKVTEEHKTHYVYDIIKFLIFFLVTNTLSNVFRNNNFNLAVISILCGIATFTILGLMIWRIEKVQKRTIIYSFLDSIIIGLAFFVLNSIYRLNPLQISLGLIFLFYIATAIIHHKIMGTLRKSVIAEYLIVIGLVLAVTYGIT